MAKKRKKKTAAKRNPSAVSLKNFTGRIRINPNKTVSVISKRRKRRAKRK